MARKRRFAPKKTKKSKLSVPKIKKKSDAAEQQDESVKITNDTVAEHREEVLSDAKKFTYPLAKSRHKVVIISAFIIILVLVASIFTSGLLLYRYRSTGDFAYQVSRIIPFPIARINGDFVSYEEFLFEARGNIFYYRNHGQEGIDIDSDSGEELITQVTAQSFEKIKLDTIARQLAKEHNIVVTDEEVDKQIEIVRAQGGVGESEEVLEDILRDFYGWDVDDLRRTIKIQLIRQKLPSIVDVKTVERAQAIEAKLSSGSKFDVLAKAHSDDKLTADNNGVIGLISRTNTDLPAEFVDAAFNLEEGQVSEIVESRFGLHIIKVNKVDGDEREVSHILFEFFDIDQYLKQKLNEADVVEYVTF